MHDPYQSVGCETLLFTLVVILFYYFYFIFYVFIYFILFFFGSDRLIFTVAKSWVWINVSFVLDFFDYMGAHTRHYYQTGS